MRYRLLEHTADAMIQAYGKDLGERFGNVAYAMFDLMTDASKIESKGELKILLSAVTREQLLVDFLQELLFIHETEGVVMGRFEVKTDGNKLEALVWGEEFDEKRHSKRAVVKAITYHKLEFDDKNGTITVLFDV